MQSYLDVQENKIITKEKCQISINYDDYDPDEICSNPEFIELPGILEVYYPDLDQSENILYNYNIKVLKTTNTIETDDDCIITYEKGETIISQEYANLNTGSTTKLFQGRVKYLKDPITLLTTMNNTMPGMLLVHFELIISNMMRNAETGEPCRLIGNYDNCEVIGQTKLAKEDSWLSALSYRDFSSVVQSTLVKQKKTKGNPIENVLTLYTVNSEGS
jgi:hypothetical protein